MDIEKFKAKYQDKFVSEDKLFECINRGDTLFVGTGCGEPQHLVNLLVKYVEANPMKVIESEVVHIWAMGVAPYTDPRFEINFRYNSFFVGDSAREAVNEGVADYTPMFLSQVPGLFTKGLLPIDVALVQVSLPDKDGNLSLGISVDINRAAVDNARAVICQVNSFMPYVHGDSLIHIDSIDYLIHHDEPLLEYQHEVSGEIAGTIGKYVARIINDGDTIQIGYGSIPDAILTGLSDKKHLGVHTELLTDGIVDLIRKGVVDNRRKNINRGKTVASFCMGSRETYEFIDNNESIIFKPIDYTNSPLVIARHRNITAINSALAVDLTGQATAESIGRKFYSGIGGQADFMRSAVFAKGGKTILALTSTAENDRVSRIVPFLPQGARVTLTTGDIHYVVTEYGEAYLHGKNVRERALELISVAHPRFRSWLIEEARKNNLIYSDQAFVPGKEGEYPEELEKNVKDSTGEEVLMRPVKISDEHMLKEFFYSLSDESNHKRFLALKRYMPHKVLQGFVALDYTKQMVILVIKEDGEKDTVIGVGQYAVSEKGNTAEVATAISDKYQNRGIGTLLLSYMVDIARADGIKAFTADYLTENTATERMLQKLGLEMKHSTSEGVCQVILSLEPPPKQ